MDEEINELNTEVTQSGRKKLSMLGSRLASPTTTLERVVTLLSWSRPHLTKKGSVPYKEERDALHDTRVFEGCPQPGLAIKLKPHTECETT